jgi:two-component system response regulator AtoC
VSDETTIDATQLGPAEDLEEPARAYLVVRTSGGTQVIDVDDGNQVVLGRSSEATVRIDDAKASREHASVCMRNGELRLVDLGSRNGTRLNQELVRGEERPLRSGDLIRIGDAEILIAGSPAMRASAGALPGGRLEAELARVRATGGGRAALVRLAGDAADLACMAPALARAALVEGQAPGEWACLVEDDGVDGVAQWVAELRRLAPHAFVAAARAPEGGVTAAELWRRAREPGPQVATGRPAVAAPAGVVVADASMVHVFELVRKVAATPTTVLILGETGVGKEVVAEQIHRQSDRARSPFVRLNCGSLPENLLESELFGHEKGAFTGADRRKRGYLEAANGGTLFLDEIGELALTMQAKLLRVLESRRFMRVGGVDEIAVDVRLLAATNRDLAAEARSARFREDLYFRLSVFVIEIPPLRERPAEVALLAELFALQLAARAGVAPPSIAADTAAALQRHRWPGNVRELRNAVEHAFVIAEGGELRAEHLPENVRRGDAASAPPTPGGPMREHLAEIEQQRIEEALTAEDGNQTRAARRLGISRRTLIYKLAKYRIRVPGRQS